MKTGTCDRFVKTLRLLQECSSALDEILIDGTAVLDGDELEAATHLVDVMSNVLSLVAEVSGADVQKDILGELSLQRTLDDVRALLSIPRVFGGPNATH